MLSKIVLKALAKNPRERYADATKLREALEGWASTSPPELDAPATPLFPKEAHADGVGSEEDSGESTVRVPQAEKLGSSTADSGDATVRVPIEEMEAVFEDNFEEEIIAAAAKPDSTTKVEMEDKTEPKTTPATKREQPAAGSDSSDLSKDEQELAAIAEQASSMVRGEKQAAAARENVKSKAAKRIEAKPAEPKLAAEPKPAEPPAETEVEGYLDEDGELVELPLEKSVRAYLAHISPTVPAKVQTGGGGNGESLDSALDDFVHQAKAWSAALPPPKVDDKSLAALIKVPVEEPPPPVVAPQPETPPPARGGSLGIALVTFLLGGLVVFGGIKLFGDKLGLTASHPDREIVAPVDRAAPAAAPTADETTGTRSADDETAAAKTADDETAAASASADKPATGEVDAGTLAGTTADAAPAGTTGDEVTTTAAGGADAGPEPKVADKVAKRDRAVRKPRKRRVRRAKARAAQKAKRASKQVDKAGATTGAKPAAKKSKSSDWVDPFSQ